jgi:lipopolysaccharide/colanic/teichoic acid biosynthesis glycosyltransferase
MTDVSNRANEPVELSPLPKILAPGRYAGRIRWRHAAERSQSGLPCYFAGNWAVLPAVTEGRFRALIGKRVIDIALASLALLVLAPLLVLTALAVKLTSEGPVFFRQQRPGLRGRPFEMLKFRTMYVNAGDASGIRQTTANDARITPIGRFLRNKSIDELPQLINVLRGDMSIVGPRPHVEGMLAGGRRYEELVPYYKLRYEMRPGLSGWAQANGFRGPTLEEEVARARIDHDLAYIQNFSLLLALKIILLTVQREFLTGNGL